MPGSEWEVATKAFDQSVEVARQADENINRLIAAVAFLALGGFTIFFPSQHPGHLHLDGSGVDAAEIFFFLFDGGVFFAVALALRALEAGSTESKLFFLNARDPEDMTSQLGRGAAHFAVAAREKARGLSRCRAAIEFSMISLALLATARLPQLSGHAKVWLISVALGTYGFGPLRGRNLRQHKRPFSLYLATALLAAGLLLAAFWLDAHWWAIGYALTWIGGSRVALSPESSTWNEESVWFASSCFVGGLAILAYLIFVR